ncbi:hypothetical protein KUCAC02_033945 [Chaenocephalus aceratus]|nr:hypothetical protein KUCAC02_033945 [Chaenocephalus aceratus]
MLRELGEIDPPVHMTTTLDVEYGAYDKHPDSFSGDVDLEADEGTTSHWRLNKEVCFLRNKLKQWKASSAKRDLRSSSATPSAESITIQQPERPASSGISSSRRYTPLVELGRPQSKYAGDEESRGEGLRRPRSAPPSVNQVYLSRRRATMPSSSGVKCKSIQKNTSHEHSVGIRRKSATPRLTDRYTPGLLEVMEDTAVNAIGAELAPSDELQGDCEDWDDRAMTDVDEPEMANEVTQLLMGQKQPKIPTISGITTPVAQPTRGQGHPPTQ